MKQDAIFVPAGEGQQMQIIGTTHVVKLAPAQAGGMMNAIEIVVPPEFGAPMHSHDIDSEFFYVLEGEITFSTPHGDIIGRPGDFCFLPAGGRHAFRNNGRVKARALVVVTPGVIAHDFFSAVDARTGGAVDVPVVTELAAQHAIHIMEPQAA